MCPILLLATDHGQATFARFSKDSRDSEEVLQEEGEEEEDTDGDDDEGTTDESEKSTLIYVRVSSEEQRKDGRSIDSQVEELTAIVENDPDLTLYQKPVRDEGKTGTNFDREGIQQVARLAQRKEVTHLMVDTIDRIGRSVAQTLMFIHELNEKFDVNIMTRTRELDIRKPTDRMQVTMQAMMADFGTRNRARSSKRSSVDNFLKDKQWFSWFRKPPFGYEPENPEGDTPKEKGWLQRIETLEPVIEDIYTEFIETENYAETARIIEQRHEEKLAEHDSVDKADLDGPQIKSIVIRPLYCGEPALPVTSFEHYEPSPSVTDPELQFVNKERSQRARQIADEIAEKKSTDDELLTEPEDYADEFDPYVIGTVSPPVRVVCPDCSSDLVGDGGQKKLNDRLGSRIYTCTNENCEYERKWPRDPEAEMMQMLTQFEEFHSILS